MIKQGDFIKLDYTGAVAGDNIVFDTTNKEVATQHDLTTPSGPVTICVGENFLLPGLDAKLIGAEIGKSYQYTLPPEEAFGKKDAKLLQMIPLSKFKQQGVVPQPGLQVSIDGAPGLIKTATGGRIIVDFNHPLAGKILTYDCTVLEKIASPPEQITSLLDRIQLPHDVAYQDEKATITLKGDLPQEIKDSLTKEIQRLTPAKDVTFTQALKSTKQDPA